MSVCQIVARSITTILSSNSVLSKAKEKKLGRQVGRLGKHKIDGEESGDRFLVVELNGNATILY